jgi:hypothetical protein
LKTGK